MDSNLETAESCPCGLQNAQTGVKYHMHLIKSYKGIANLLMMMRTKHILLMKKIDIEHYKHRKINDKKPISYLI